MTRRTQTWLAGIAVFVVVGTTVLALVRIGALSGESLFTAPVETVSLDLPERSGLLSLDLPTDPLLAPYVARHVTVERAGQEIINTALFPAVIDSEGGLGLFWIPAVGRSGPWVRLTDQAGDILLDLRAFTAMRVTMHGAQAWLVPPSGVAAAGYVVDADGGRVPTQGHPFNGLPNIAESVPLGRVLMEHGQLMFQAG